MSSCVFDDDADDDDAAVGLELNLKNSWKLSAMDIDRRRIDSSDLMILFA